MEIPYGRSRLALEWSLPETDFWPPAAPPPCPEVVAELQRSLNHPLNSPALDQLLAGKRQVTLVVPDKTRPAALRQLLPPLLGRIEELGLPADRLTLLVALGIHVPMTWQELHEHLGPEICSCYRVLQNLAKNAAEMVSLGQTSRGTPVALHRAVAEADLVLALGSVAHHYTAGFGGGRKLLVPGCASYQTCLGNHALVLAETANHPACQAGNTENNPVHEDMLEAARKLPVPSFFIQVVLTSQGAVHRLFAGDMEAAHRAAVDCYSEIYGRFVQPRYDALIAGCGGHPRDINFIQAHKVLQNVAPLVKEGGLLLVLAECPDGYGHADFGNWLQMPDLEEMFARLKKNYVIYGQTALSTKRKSRRWQIHLCSSLSPQETAAMEMNKLGGAQEIAALIQRAFPGHQPRCAIVPDGANFWARLKEEKT